MKGLFITGSDTNVGKTFFSTLLMLHAQKKFADARYLKPVQTGSEHDATTVHALSKGNAQHLHSFKCPASPHLAAQKENTRLELRRLVAETKAAMEGDFHLVEGAGGILVPLNERHLMIDLMAALALPIVLVTRTTLGTINHTLLSLAALKAQGLSVKAVVMIGEKHEDNRKAIAHFSKLDRIYHVPWLLEVNHNHCAELALSHAPMLDAIIQ